MPSQSLVFYLACSFSLLTTVLSTDISYGAQTVLSHVDIPQIFNRAAWLTAAKAKPLAVGIATYTSPGDDEIVIENSAVAVNPIDWKIQELALFPIHYPVILGSDVAGHVYEVGTSVARRGRFKKGDRVLAHTTGALANDNSRSGFQLYSVVSEQMTSPIPNHISFQEASVLPLGISTASAGLFLNDTLNLELPSMALKSNGKTLLVWGGSSSVGSNAIQLAKAAGYEVITTASPRNFNYTKRLGASKTFDYSRIVVIDEIIDALRGKEIAGAFDAINANGAIQACAAILDAVNGTIIATVGSVPDDLPEGVQGRSISATKIKGTKVAEAIYANFLPQALKEGVYSAAPPPKKVGTGLGAIQKGLDVQRKGVSAEKVVIAL